ncbi:MAG: hypothetical protein CMH98_20020 [Oceanospirillaceae bacterium]|nr:hypothetical protein [Oceanospirillaceae bacterium]|tara:strand:+ start:144682 stop:146937 length:2256 start_codon:yes stop_codon:yes gene_type:complete
MIKPHKKTPLAVALLLAGMATAAHSVELEQVTVYGEKQEKSMRDTATSVQVLDAEDMEEQPITDFNDVFARVANVTSLDAGSQRTSFAIRGVSVDGVAGSNTARTAGIVVDGVGMANEVLRYGGPGIWDLQQVEVLRGPQGTLQGQNSLMGTIVIRSKNPTFYEEGAVQAQYASFNTFRTSGTYSNALTDTLAFRVSADRYQSDGAIKNVTRNDDEYASTDRGIYRGKLLWQPSDSLSAMLTLQAARHDLGAGNSVRDDRSYSREAVSDAADNKDVRSDLAILEVNNEFSDELKLTYIGSVQKNDYDRYDDYDSGTEAGNEIDQYSRSRVQSHELRLSFDNGTVSGVAGLFFNRNHQNLGYDLQSLYPLSSFESTITNYYESELGVDATTAQALYDNYIPTLTTVGYDTASEEWTSNKAVFGELTWNINYNWAITAGLRHDRESKTRWDVADAAILDEPNTNPTEIVPGLTAGALVNSTLSTLASTLNEPRTDTDSDYTATLPKLVVTYYVNDDLAFSALTQKGYRAGGAMINIGTGQLVEYDPEYTWNYELAMRSDWLDHRLMVNSNIYYIDWTDQQVLVTNSGDSTDSEIDNAGKSELYGLEVEVSAALSDNLTLSGSYGYAHTEFKDFDTGDENFDGNEFRHNAKHSANLMLDYRLGSWQAVANGSFVGSNYGDNDNTTKIPGYGIVNLKMNYDINRLRLSGWVTNLFDREYLTDDFERLVSASTVGTQDNLTIGQPRMIGAGVLYSF